MVSTHPNLISSKLVHDFKDGQTVPEYISGQIQKSLDQDEAQKLTMFIAKSREKFSKLIAGECRVVGERQWDDGNKASTSTDEKVLLSSLLNM